MSINSGNDNISPDVFIKRDGSVWATYAPPPPGLSGNACYRSAGDKELSWKLPAGKAAAVRVAVGEAIFMLDAEHKLWTTKDSWLNTKFFNVPLNLK